MKISNGKFFTIIICSVIVTACSDQLTYKSITDDEVVISGPPKEFVGAYTMAQKECAKNVRLTEYQPDSSEQLRIVAFNCNEIQTEETPVESEEPSTGTEETSVEETEVISEETSAEAEEVSTETEAAPIEAEEEPAQ